MRVNEISRVKRGKVSRNLRQRLWTLIWIRIRVSEGGIPDEAMEPGYFEGEEAPDGNETVPWKRTDLRWMWIRRLESLTSDVKSVPDESNRVLRLINRVFLDSRSWYMQVDEVVWIPSLVGKTHKRSV